MCLFPQSGICLLITTSGSDHAGRSFGVRQTDRILPISCLGVLAPLREILFSNPKPLRDSY
jgi:hypothetical protein